MTTVKALCRGALAAMTAAYEPLRHDGTLPASYEVVYGAAWGNGVPAPRADAGGEVRIPLASLRRK